MLTAFDAPVMETNCTARTLSNSAPQSLLLMNSRFALDASEWLADAALARARSRAPLASDPAIDYQLPRMSVWEFGWGSVQTDAAGLSSVSFTPLKHWTGSSLQAGPVLPDPLHGWVLLTPQGGHPGDAAHACIRRYNVPASGSLKITGSLSRPAENGDGVRARIVSSRRGVLGEWIAPSGSIPTNLDIPAVEVGEILDLVVDCRNTVESDSFAWSASLALADTAGKPLGTWKTEESLAAPTTPIELLGPAAAEAWKLTRGRSLEPAEHDAIRQFALEQVRYLSSEGKGRAPDIVKQVLINLSQSLIGSNEFLDLE
jgi:hypothetical protein